MAGQTIVGVVADDSKATAVAGVWKAIEPYVKYWLETSSSCGQKIKIEIIFKPGDLQNFDLICNAHQHSTFRFGSSGEAPPFQTQRLSDGVLDDRLKHAESHVKPLLVEAMSVKRQPNRSLKVLMAINYGSIIWVEKTSGVEVLAPKI